MDPKDQMDLNGMGKLAATLRQCVVTAAWWALSVPIFIKIAGIGLLVTVLFGTVVFYQIKVGLFRTHYQVHGETALSLAMALAVRLDPLVRANNEDEMHLQVNQVMGEFPDVRYIVVQDPSGKILSHGFTFPSEAPSDLLQNKGDLCASCHAALPPQEISSDMLEVPAEMRLSLGHLRAYTRHKGMILEVTAPIGDGSLGSVRLGIGDRVILREIRAITHSLLGSVFLCSVIGLSFALFLALALVKPIHNLLQATNRLRQGDFAARANVYSKDEIGHLASVFNQMAEGLETYRDAVQEKEAARQSLIGKIVQAQEEERKSVARELHDQIGQSLSSTLLTMESSCKNCMARHPECDEIKDDIRGMIDEVRRLAWNVRPSILDDYGLGQALARYINEIAKRASFSIDYQCVLPPEHPRLPSQIEVTLYRVAQEAMTNILRHAQATQVSVILMRHENEITLILEDNGKGFDMDALEERSTPPLGIIGMKERVALVGGDLTVVSHSGHGTTIRVRIPVDKETLPTELTMGRANGHTGLFSG